MDEQPSEHKIDLIITRGMNNKQRHSYYKKLRKQIAKEAYEQEKIRCESEKRDKREKEIQKKAKDKAFKKYGMTRKEKAINLIERVHTGVEKTQRSIEFMQKDLEQDLRNEGFDLGGPIVEKKDIKKDKKKAPIDPRESFSEWALRIP